MKPTDAERTAWGEGDASGLRPYKRPYASISGLNCWEHNMVLPGYALMAQGTQVHVAAFPGHETEPAAMSSTRQLLLAKAFASQGAAYVVLVGGMIHPDDIADPELREVVATTQPMNGGSYIIDPMGEVIAGPAQGEEILVADASLDTVRAAKAMCDVAGHYSRPDLLRLVVNRSSVTPPRRGRELVTTVVITGANRGLGLALATHYLSHGATVIGGCRNPAAADALEAAGAEVHQLDTGSGESIVAFGSAVGDRPVDLLFNNAGIDSRAVGANETARGALDLTEAQFRSVMDVNVLGPMLMVQALAANLTSAGGKVINVSSQVGSFEVAHRIGSDIAYGTSKAALNMLSLKQSQGLRSAGISVIALHPGWLRSDMGGSRADLDPADAAASIAKVVDNVTIEQTGSFLRWDGSTHPW